MPINTLKYQTVVLPKDQLEKAKRIAPKLQLTRIVGFALDMLITDKELQKKLNDWIKVA